MYSIDIDIGGTFTDGFFSDGGQIRTRKVLTTPHDVSECFMNCVRSGSEAFELGLEDFLLKTNVARVSTTIGTNLLVQRAGPRIGLVVTAGAERSLYGRGDATVIGRYVAANMVIGVNESVGDDGRVAREPDAGEVLAAVRQLVQNGARMVVISFANAWRNAANERNAREVVRARYPVHYLRSVPLQLGTDIVHVSDDHARTNSGVLNAYVHGEMARRLYRAEDLLRAAGYARPLLVVHANGGNARVAKTVALNTLHSGPAAAVRGAVTLAKLLGMARVVTADMGGTSLDISVIRDAKLPMSDTSHAAGAEIAVPMIELDAVGAGGGSLASVKDGALRVGPESAGSAPGPVCYAKGGVEPTVTDANVVLGYIDPEYFLGGKMRLDRESARRAVERRIARPLKVSPEQACRMIRDQVNRSIAAEINARLGGEPAASFTLFAFGGCGPLHACAIAAAMGVRRIVAFPFASVFSAFGSSTTDIRHSYARTLGAVADAAGEAAATLRSFREQAIRDMAGEGFATGDIRMVAELRIVDRMAAKAQAQGTNAQAQGTNAQARTVALSPERSLEDSVEDIRRAADGGSIDSVRLAAECPVPHWEPGKLPEAAGALPQPKGRRKVFWETGEAVETAIYDALAFQPGHRLQGPVIVEAPDTAIVVDAGWVLSVDPYGNSVMTRA